MSQTQTIIWTVLPNGFFDGYPKFSVLVSPRLNPDSDTNLGQFEDFINWTDTVTEIEFEAYIAGSNQPIRLEKGFQLYPKLWPRIFPPQTLVRPHKFKDLSTHNLRSFPVRRTMNYLKNNYTQWVNKCPVHPDMTQLKIPQDSLLKDLGGITSNPQKAGDNVERLIRSSHVFSNYVKSKSSTNPTSDYYQAHAFYNRPVEQDHHPSLLNVGSVPPPLEAPEFDFHVGLAMLGDHPTLMRWLGLVLDFVLPITIAAGTGAIRIKPQWQNLPNHEGVDITPFTQYSLQEDKFLAKWEDKSDLRDGFLNLEQAREFFEESASAYHLVEVDVDGAALKLLHFCDSLQRPSYKMDPEVLLLPALRSAGLGLARDDRAPSLFKHLQMVSKRNNNLLANNPNTSTSPNPQDYFLAEDLLRGYRVDVEDKTTDQRLSLCWQQGQYIFKTGKPVSLPAEEGYIKRASASATSPESAPSPVSNPSELYLHEMLFRWTGWSLCAPHPNRTVVSTIEQQSNPATGDVMAVQNDTVGQPRSRPQGPIDLEPLLEAVPGTLPRLRFGHTYRLRVRAVDVAGNSLSADHPDWSKASQPVVYQRFEPIPSPVLVLHDEPTPGESIERMVIRSNYNTRATRDSQRHVVPPKTSQEMAETHGMFDPYIGPGKDHAAGYNIALMESGTLADREIIDIKTGNLVTLPYADMINVKQVDGPDVDVDGNKIKINSTVIHGEDTLILPYLPDPLATGATLRGIPRLDSTWLSNLEKVLDKSLNLQAIKIPFEMDWPESKPFRIRLAERNGQMVGNNCEETFDKDKTSQAQWDSQKRVLTIHLAKGEKAHLVYSCYPANTVEGQHAIWKWLKSQPNTNKLLKYLRAGCLWIISPYRRLELVHAVQQPLCEPTLDANVQVVKKDIGQTGVKFEGTATLNAWSTEKIDLLAEWKDWDDTSSNSPRQIDRKAHASDSMIQYTEPNTIKLGSGKPGAVVHPLQHEFGDTLHHWVDYHLVGTSRYREYFDPGLDLTRKGPVRRLNVLNSARPAVPKVVYVLPTFGWTTHINGNTITRLRIGGGLRVYLERPWYSSGEDELLGVVLAQQTPKQLLSFPHLQPYVTQLGLDPIWNTTMPDTVLDKTDFSNYTAAGENLFLDELSNTAGKPSLVNVVGYTPQFNEERGLWFCDVMFNAERLSSYYPFVRMALARYQPYSIPRPPKSTQQTFLSPVVMTDFVQLAPSRALQITGQSDEKTVEVSLSGYVPLRYTSTAAPAPLPPLKEKYTNRVQLTIEKHDINMPGDLGWFPIEETQEQANPIWLNNKGLAVNNDTYLWNWNEVIKLPAPRTSEKFRLVVKEYEEFTADGPITRGIDYERRIKEVEGLRLVYADTIEL